MASLPLILFPGMGADERMFAAQREVFANLIVPRWITPTEKESFASYAKRLAGQIDPGGPCLIGGASFGGFVAMEMARHLHARACFLIGSVRSPSELPRRIRVLRTIRAVTTVLPFGIVCRLAGIGAMSCGQLSSPTVSMLARQLSEADAEFLRWATRAVLTWQACASEIEVPVYHIHGRCDPVLPVSLTKPDVVVEGAGHVLSMTHPREVNDFIRARIELQS